jgi:hypothetical protein
MRLRRLGFGFVPPANLERDFVRGACGDPATDCVTVRVGADNGEERLVRCSRVAAGGGLIEVEARAAFAEEEVEHPP